LIELLNQIFAFDVRQKKGKSRKQKEVCAVQSKRSEYFRFEFEQPIEATLRITEINGVQKVSKPASVQIINLSPHGIKIQTPLNFQLDHAERIKVEVRFNLDYESLLVVNGIFVWQKKKAQEFSYGIEIVSTDESEKMIIEELKKYSKQTVHVKKNRH
jgi:hypothetical protein